METNNARMERYYWYKDHGICVNCGKQPAFYNHTLCPKCMEKATIERAERRAKDGDKIRAYYAEYARQWRKKRKDAGLCQMCGKPVVSGIMCEACKARDREKKARYQRLRRGSLDPGEKFRERASMGVCVYCCKPVVPGYHLCAEHLPKKQEVIRENNKRNKTFQEINNAGAVEAVAKKGANVNAKQGTLLPP